MLTIQIRSRVNGVLESIVDVVSCLVHQVRFEQLQVHGPILLQIPCKVTYTISLRLGPYMHTLQYRIVLNDFVEIIKHQFRKADSYS